MTRLERFGASPHSAPRHIEEPEIIDFRLPTRQRIETQLKMWKYQPLLDNGHRVKGWGNEDEFVPFVDEVAPGVHLTARLNHEKSGINCMMCPVAFAQPKESNDPVLTCNTLMKFWYWLINTRNPENKNSFHIPEIAARNLIFDRKEPDQRCVFLEKIPLKPFTLEKCDPRSNRLELDRKSFQTILDALYDLSERTHTMLQKLDHLDFALDRYMLLRKYFSNGSHPFFLTPDTQLEDLCMTEIKSENNTTTPPETVSQTERGWGFIAGIESKTKGKTTPHVTSLAMARGWGFDTIEAFVKRLLERELDPETRKMIIEVSKEALQNS